MKLIFLVVQDNGCFTYVTDVCPKKVKVDKETKTWTYTNLKSEKETSRIGEYKHRLNEVNYPLGVFDSNQLEHLQALVEATNRFMESRYSSLMSGID